MLGENLYGFRSGGKKTRNANAMLRIISGRTFDIEKKLCAFFIDWQMNWTELMHILNVTVIDWS